MSTKLPELPELKVYVSSTSDDLKSYRAEVITALRKMEGIKPVCMEDYVAQDKFPVDKCLADVSTCNIYVGIFARRYGFIPRGDDKSITELEYRKAVEVGIPPLIFLLKESIIKWPDKYCDKGKDKLRINALKKEFKDLHCFSSDGIGHFP
ncbi:MAG: DUF4062 domain-containing protein [Nitrospirae bacterium]|nr:DUF4062 domain-containing protein [Nitrospirota bacterium]